MTNNKLLDLWLEMKSFLLGTVGIVVMLNGSVAFMAFCKDILLASYFGTSEQADALTLAYFLPDTIGNNLIASALGVACVPVFVKLYAVSERKAMQQIRISLLLFSLLGLVVTISLYVWSQEIARWLAGSSHSHLGQMTTSLTRIMLPTVIILPAFAIGSSLLQVNGNFTIPAAVPLLSHGLIITALLYCMALHIKHEQAVYWVSWAIASGVAVMTAVVWKGLSRRNKLKPHSVAVLKEQTDRRAWRVQLEIWRTFVPYLMILASSQAVYFVERQFSSSMEVGTVAGLNYAFRLSQFPVWVFVAAVYSVALPSLAQDLAFQRTEKLQQTLAKAFKDILIVTLPTTLIFYILRVPIVSILFQRGAFDMHSVQITSNVLKGYALSIVGLSISAICLRYFLAAGKMGWPLGITVISSGINIMADVLLKDSYGAGGLGYGAAIGATVSAIMFLLLLAGKVRFSGKKVMQTIIPMALANAIPCIFLLLLANSWDRIQLDGNELTRILILVCTIGLYAAAYYAALRRFNMIKRS